MSRSIARGLNGLVQSDIRAMTRECTARGGINLGQGVCRLPIEPAILEAASEAIHGDRNSYTHAEGIRPLRAAIADKILEYNGLRADPDTEIVVTAGTTAAYTSTLVALLNRGDGVLFLEPYYAYHVGVASILGLVPEFVELEEPRFLVTEEALRRVITPQTRAVVLCTPNNPSGRMLELPELEAVATVAHERDLLVITDEIYEFIRFDGRRHISPASVLDLGPRTVSVMGMSKTYSVTGWRLGYLIAKEEMARPITLCHDLCYICAPAPLQHAALTALRLPGSYYQELARAYQERRDRLCGALAEGGLRPVVPEGSYFALADIQHLGFEKAKDAAMELLDSCGVAAVPGTEFFTGQVGERFLRFCFAVEDDLLTEACKRLAGGRFSNTGAQV